LIAESFIETFKTRTELRWKTRQLDPRIYGFQFQAGTGWNIGLSDGSIDQYEGELGVRFPDGFRRFLKSMNGTDTPTVNVYGTTCQPVYGTGVYSYPADLEIVKERQRTVDRERREITLCLKDQGFELNPEADLIPFFSHRFLLSDPGSPEIPVLSIHGVDAIVYASTFRGYLELEFLGG